MKSFIKYKVFAVLFLSLMFINDSVSQRLRFEKYTTEDGLSVGTVWSVLQDANGYLWFGTANGLNKFDGYQFTVYKHREADGSSLSDNNIYDLVQDSGGIIWIGTALGLNKYDPLKNEFSRITGKDSSCQTQDIVIKSLAVDANGIIWMGTEYSGLLSYNPKEDCFANHNTFLFPNVGEGVYIRDIYIDKKHIIWLGTETKGLYKYDNNLMDISNYRFRKTDDNEFNLLNNNINEIYVDSKNQMWIGTYRGAIHQFDEEKESFVSYGNSTEAIKKRNRVTSFAEDRYGTLWVATYGGLSYFDDKINDFVKYYTPSENDPRSINSSRLLSLLCDKAGSLWIGCYDNGINVVHNTQPEFIIYQKEDNNPKSLSDNIIVSFEKDEEGNLLIGTVNGGLNLLDEEAKTFTHLRNKYPVLANPVLSIHRDPSNNLWFGSWGSGLIKLSDSSNKTTVFTKNDEPNSISNNTILTIHQLSDSILWIGTFNGLNRLHISTNTFTTYTTNDGLQSNVIFYITSNNKDTLFIGTKDGGFSILDMNTMNFTNYLYDNNDIHSISNNVVHHIHNDEIGNLWLATERGLNKYIKNRNRFISFTEDNGLPDNKIYAILEDDSGYLWLSTDKGICKFNPFVPIGDAKSIRNFDVNDGLQGNEFSQGAYFKDQKTGKLYFGGTNGFTVFHPDQITENPHKPEVYITSFKIFDKEVSLDTSILFKNHIELSYKSNFLSFEFVGLDYLNPSKNLFQYKMEGLDVNWSTPTSRRYASYPGMKHGNYTFRVRAANNDGIWNNEGAGFSIYIKPPFWKTNWFIFTTIFAGIASILLYIRFRTYRLKQEKKVLEEKVAERTKELQKKNQDIMDSITYAQRIQEAILPKIAEFDKHFEDTLVIYKPKDIVSGDFFWYTTKDQTRIFAAADCTGHGVPGAFMSIIGNNLLEKVVNEQNIKVPGMILDELHLKVKEALHQKGKKGDTFDGMDIAICAIDKDSDVLYYAGAYRPLVHISDGKATKYTSNKYSIGGAQVSQDKIFKTKEIKIKPGDRIYVFSDGYIDQFGGPDDRKFMIKNLIQELVRLKNYPLLEQEFILEEIIDNWMYGYDEENEQIDDILLVGVEF